MLAGIQGRRMTLTPTITTQTRLGIRNFKLFRRYDFAEAGKALRKTWVRVIVRVTIRVSFRFPVGYR